MTAPVESGRCATHGAPATPWLIPVTCSAFPGASLRRERGAVMRPEPFRIGGLTFHAYWTLLAAAVLVCTLLAVRESRRRREGFVLPPQIGVWGLLGALAGARLFFAIQHTPPDQWWRAIFLWEGGLTLYGGVLGGALAAGLFLKRAGIPWIPVFDIMAPYMALGEAIIRVGCFLNGCCWGRPTSLPWGLSFPAGSAVFVDHALAGRIDPAVATTTAPLHPTQLYQVVGLLVVAGLLKMLLARKPFPGAVALGYLALYGVLRFGIEFLRDDSARSVFGLTVSGAISAVLAVAGTTLFFALASRRKRRSAEPPVSFTVLATSGEELREGQTKKGL